jgi:hypothetical protein
VRAALGARDGTGLVLRAVPWASPEAMQPRSARVWIIAAVPPGVALDLPPDPSISGFQVDELPAQPDLESDGSGLRRAGHRCPNQSGTGDQDPRRSAPDKRLDGVGVHNSVSDACGHTWPKYTAAAVASASPVITVVTRRG